MSNATTLERAEIARERETFRYDTALIQNIISNSTINLIPSSQLRTSQDVTLTTFCQLVALRLNCARALISLFDQHSQYVVAEATASSSLLPDATDSTQLENLWLCGTYFPRSFGVCNHVLVAPTKPSSGHGSNKHAASFAPVTVISDLSTHETYRDRPYCHAWPNNRFYAGVPLQTPRGINIGVLCVFDDKARSSLDKSSTRTMQEIGLAVMTYLEKRRTSERYRQADRVARGIQTLFHRRPHHASRKHTWPSTTESLTETITPKTTCSLDRDSISETSHASNPAVKAKPSLDPQPLPESFGTVGQPQPSPLANALTPCEDGHDRVQHTLTRACNIFRSALELDGLVLLDASRSASNIQATADLRRCSQTGDSSASSSEEGPVHGNRTKAQHHGSICSVLGVSTSPEVKRNGDSYFSHSILRERTLRKLLRYFPRGTIWTYDKHGEVESSDASSDETSFGSSDEDLTHQKGTGSTHRSQQVPENGSGKPQAMRKLRKEVLGLLPGAQSVAFFPIWDAHKQRWFAGGFAYTQRSCRPLSIKAELSYLRAFGAVVMAQVTSVKAEEVERSKLGVLNSISHELRSPLHGIILSTELMRDSSLNASQEDAIRSIEVCSRTLLDTIDQILDWTKINNFASSHHSKSTCSTEKDNNRVARALRNNSIEVDMMSLTQNVNLATLVEDVVETMHAGHTFQTLPSLQGYNTLSSAGGDDGGVKIILAFPPSHSWWFRVPVGAIRRIVMNVLGNSLKYTDGGVIYIQLEHLEGDLKSDHDSAIPKFQSVRLIIADTGCGISEDYLTHDVFTPFTQEDNIGSGAGLGLSVVKRIVQSLRGSIEIQSTPNVGTTVQVDLPLEVCQRVAGHSPADGRMVNQRLLSNDEALLAKSMDDIRGLRVRLMGFQENRHQNLDGTLLKSSLSEDENLTSICQKWLGLTVISPSPNSGMCPDAILCNEGSLDQGIDFTEGGKSIPLVAICRNIVAARQLAVRDNLSKNSAAIDQWIYFTHHPTGPNKLARIISRAIRGWMSKQHLQENQPTQYLDVSSGQPPFQKYDPVTPPTNGDDNLFEARYTLAHRGGLRRLSLPCRPLQSPAATPAEKPNPFDMITQIDKAFLLVDDNAINLKVLSTFIKKLGFPYDTATDGQQALTCYEKNPERYKCIFMDISMPIMNGFDATRAIRARESKFRLPKCPILALTGLASQESQTEALSCGIDLFLTKPVKLADLRQILTIRELI